MKKFIGSILVFMIFIGFTAIYYWLGHSEIKYIGEADKKTSQSLSKIQPQSTEKSTTCKPSQGVQPKKCASTNNVWSESFPELSASELMDVGWDSLGFEAISNQEQLKTLIVELPIQNKGLVKEQQLSQLHDTLSTLAGTYINDSNLSSYLNFLKENNEIPITNITTAIKNMLLDEAGIKESEIPTESWELIYKYVETARQSGLEPHWDGLIKQNSQIKFFKTHTEKISNPGTEWQAIRGKIVSFFHVFEGKSSLPKTISNKGECVVADVTLLVKHDEKLGNIVRPYILRFWYDEISEVWRPLSAYAFPNTKENFPVFFIF